MNTLNATICFTNASGGSTLSRRTLINFKNAEVAQIKAETLRLCTPFMRANWVFIEVVEPDGTHVAKFVSP